MNEIELQNVDDQLLRQHSQSIIGDGRALCGAPIAVRYFPKEYVQSAIGRQDVRGRLTYAFKTSSGELLNFTWTEDEQRPVLLQTL